MLDPKAILDWTGGPALGWVLLAATLYWLGGRHGARPRASATGRWRAACFVAGLATIVIALDTSIDDLADQLLWVHMVQHVLLLVVAPPLLALGRPWNRMWHGFPLGLRRRAARAVTQSPQWAPVRRAARLLRDPVPSWILFNATLIAWHLPAAYDLTLRSSAVHALEHAMFFGQKLRGRPMSPLPCWSPGFWRSSSRWPHRRCTLTTRRRQAAPVGSRHLPTSSWRPG